MKKRRNTREAVGLLVGLLLVIFGLAVVSAELSAAGATTSHPTYALGKAKSCRTGYVKTTEKVKGKRTVECVYKAPIKPAPATARASIDPDFTQNPSDPLEVTFSYSVDETDGLLPSGILSFYQGSSPQSQFLACSIDVGGSTNGGTCSVTFAAYGSETVTVQYVGVNVAPATETLTEDIENTTPPSGPTGPSGPSGNTGTTGTSGNTGTVPAPSPSPAPPSGPVGGGGGGTTLPAPAPVTTTTVAPPTTTTSTTTTTTTTTTLPPQTVSVRVTAETEGDQPVSGTVAPGNYGFTASSFNGSVSGDTSPAGTYTFSVSGPAVPSQDAGTTSTFEEWDFTVAGTYTVTGSFRSNDSNYPNSTGQGSVQLVVS